MFIAALFTIAKTWKQPTYLSTEKWIKKMWYLYTMEYYSAINKNEIPFTATRMDLESIMLSEVKQWKMNIIWNHLYMESKKGGEYKWTYLQNRNRLTDFEKLLVTKGDRDRFREWEGWTGGVSDWHMNTEVYGTIASRNLLYSSENSTQYSVWEKNNLCGKRIWKRMNMCICVTGSLCCTAEIITAL